MLRNYVTVTLRSIREHKSSAIINIFGLAVGLACCLIAVLFTRDELSYDRFHNDADQIQLVTIQNELNGIATSGGLTADLAHNVREALPSIDHLTHVSDQGRVVVRVNDFVTYQEDFLQTDPEFFDIFNFSLERGDPETALERPGTIVITPAVANRFFGDSDPMGRTLHIQGETEYEVTGILAPPPSNTHLRFSMLGSFATYLASDEYNPKAFRANWNTYVHLKDGYPAERFQADVEPIVSDYVGGHSDDKWELILDAVPDLYLHPASFQARSDDLRGDVQYIYIFSAIAILILLIACVNYMNLATARAVRRTREIGIRKVVGAHRSQLVHQFLGESMIFCVLALIVALALVELMLPGFNQITGKKLSLQTDTDGLFLLAALGIALLMGLIAGGYPALFLSSFGPMDIFRRSTLAEHGHRSWLRKGLVIFQFGVSAFLIVSTLVIQKQLHFIQDQNLGLDTEQVLMLTPRDQLKSQYAAFKQELLRTPGILSVSTAPLPGGSIYPFKKPGEDEVFYEEGMPVDFDFMDMMGIEIVDGRAFDPAISTDADRAMIVNQAAVHKMGWEDDPIGQKMEVLDLQKGGFKEVAVVGVARDFNTGSLQYNINPTFLFITNNPSYQSILVKLDAKSVSSAVEAVGDLWKKFEPEFPFEYGFMDEKFQEFYLSERRLAGIFSVFSFLTIFIACMGLFGLAAFMTEQRTKEIGIRKALGATVLSVVSLLSKEFLQLVLIAAALFTPLAYWGLERWLDNFAYRIDVGLTPFLIAGGLSLMVAVLTIGTQTIRAARSNPVDALRRE